MKRSSSNFESRGFTLTELLMVLAVLTILLTLAPASFMQLGDSTRQQVLSNNLLNDLRFTRSEAILRGERVVMCVAASSVVCSTSGGWHLGWLLFVDIDNSGTREASEPIVRYRSAAPTGWIISGNRPVSRFVSYDALGATRLTSGAFQAGTVTICRSGARDTKARRVTINSIGRPRIQDVTIAQCG